VLADVILFLTDARQFLAAMDVDACLRLAQHGASLDFVKGISH